MLPTATKSGTMTASLRASSALAAAGVRTPALLLDLQTMDRNMRRMAEFFQNRSAKLRPHFKAHQVLSIASRQIAAGAIGITCARLEHAEKLVGAGIGSVLIANEIAGESSIRRLIELCLQASVIVAIDSPAVASDMARLAGNHRSALNIVVDVNLGLNRCGVAPGADACELAKLVLAKGLTLRGLMGYRGNLRLPDGPEKQQRVTAAMQELVATKRFFESEGIRVEIVTSGGTTDYSLVGAYPGVTEVQAGSYLMMDQWKTQYVSDFTPALSIATTVVSRRDCGRVVTDAGLKVMSGFRGMPKVKGVPGLVLKALHAEHCLMEIADPALGIEAGDTLEIWVEYLDATISRHRQMYGFRDGILEQVFEIEH